MGIGDSMRNLMAQIGRPAPKLRPSKMDERLAEPGAIFSRPPFEGFVSFGMTPDRLGTYLRGADGGDVTPWLMLAEEIEEKFSHYSAVLAKRRRQVAQLPVTVEAASDDAAHEKHAELVRAWLKTRALERATFDILDAVGKGFSVCEIIWDTTPRQFWPGRLNYLPTRWMQINWEDGEQVLLRDEAGYVGLADNKFLVHLHPTKSGGIIRSGLTYQVAWLWMFSAFTLRDWAIFCQSYGLPIRVGRYGPEASEDDKRVLWRAVSSVAGNVAAMIPKSMEIEFMKGGDRTADTKLYMERADWLNREVSKLVLGSTAGTEALAGGHAVGREHRQVEEDVERFDAGLLSASLSRQIARPMVDYTFGPPADGRYPEISVGRPDEVPLQIWGPLVTAFAGAGLKFRAEDVYARLQTARPEAGDEVFGGIPAEQAAAGGGGQDAITHDLPPLKTLANLNPLATQTRRESRTRWLAGLISAHAAERRDDWVEVLSEKLGEEAEGALDGMTESVRREFEQAADMHDLASRLGRLKLDPDAFAQAMTQGMMLAELVGQAALVEQLRPGRP